MTVMFWNYYGKMLKYRVVLAVIMALLVIVLGHFVLPASVVPNFGMLLKEWLYGYYLLAVACIAIGVLASAGWLKYGLDYSNLKARKYLSVFIGVGAVVALTGIGLAFVLLPPALEGYGLAAAFATLGGVLYYYLDAAMFVLPPLRGLVPKSKALLSMLGGRLGVDKPDALLDGEGTFFTDYLVLVPLDVVALGEFKWESLYTVTWNGIEYKALYPLKPELSHYLPVEELASYVVFENVNTASCDGLQVVLNIPYEDRRFAPKIVSRLFTTGKVKILSEAPVAAVWPNFTLKGLRRWNRYYFYYESAETVEDNRFYLRPYWPDGQGTLREIYAGQGHCEVLRGSEYPQIIACMLKAEEPVYCGFLLTEAPQEIAVPHYKKGIFGIDFGTVNTMIYFASDTEAARPWQLGSRVKMLWQGNDVQAKLRQNFISPSASNELEAWILSSFHIYNEDMQKQESDLFQDGNVFYVHGFEDLGSLQNVLGELKWQHENTVYRQAFLAQLCAQCMAEAAAQGITDISWRYSYPKAFSQAEWVSYSEVWHNVLTLLKTMSGPQSELAIGCELDKDFAVSESLALAAYCDKTGVEPLGNGSICMDIGGGSTDIVFWYGKDPKITWQDSLRFAGHNILRDYLLHGKNSLLLKELCSSDDLLKQVEELHRLACVTAKNDTKQQRNAFTIRLDALLKYGADELMEKLKSVENSLQVNHFISTVTFGLSGLFYYCGLMFGKLCREGRYQQLQKFHSIYVAGNGSRLLDMAAGGGFGSDTKLYKLLAQIFRDGVSEGAGAELFKGILDSMDLKVINIIKSAAPKAEIAQGLFSERAAELGLKFAAEESAEDVQPLIDENAEVHETDLQAEYDAFMKFLEHYNDLAEKFLQQKLHLRSQDSIVRIEEAIRGKAISGVPPFIAALEAVLADLNQDADGIWKNWVYLEANNGKEKTVE